MSMIPISQLSISSILGKIWSLKKADDRLSLLLSQRLEISDTLARLLVSRSIEEEKTAQLFLSPTLRTCLPEPFCLLDMQKAVSLLVNICRSKKTVGILADYDVDGATSSALLRRFFKDIGIPTQTYIPDRQKEGYGPSIQGLTTLAKKGADVIFTLDCGTTAFEPLAWAKEQGLTVIVVDHHVSEPSLPEASGLINPNRIDESDHNRQSLGSLAAVGVTFLLCVALNRQLREEGLYGSLLKEEPDLREYLDLVALGTICDVVSLHGLNRAFVSQGLKILAKRRNLGLAALCDVVSLSEKPDTYHAGFILGPRINAGGRVGEAHLGSDILSTYDPIEAREIANRLHLFNKTRQEIEEDVLQDALFQAQQQVDINKSIPPILTVSNNNWHVGVIGIVAGRLKEKYDRPVSVISFDEQGIGKASARSISGVPLGSLIHQAKEKGLLLAGGGHAMAGGFTIERSKVKDFHSFLEEKVSSLFQGSPPISTLSLDGILQPRSLTSSFLDSMEKLAPFGMGNPTPRFAFLNMRLIKTQIMGQAHLKAFFQGEEGSYLESVLFRAFESPLGEALLSKNHKFFHVAGTIKRNRWQGQEKPQLTIEDISYVNNLP